MESLEAILQHALDHALDYEDETEGIQYQVGDLETALRIAFEVMTEEQREEVFQRYEDEAIG